MSHLVDTHKIQSQDRDSIAESIRQRESSMSTGIEFGVGNALSTRNRVGINRPSGLVLLRTNGIEKVGPLS